MSIRPVDLQLMVPKSTEVNRTTQVDARRPELAHQQFAEQLQKQVTHNQQHVMSSNKSEGQNINKDGSNKNEQQANKNKRNREKEKNDGQIKQKSTSMFDMSV